MKQQQRSPAFVRAIEAADMHLAFAQPDERAFDHVTYFQRNGSKATAMTDVRTIRGHL